MEWIQLAYTRELWSGGNLVITVMNIIAYKVSMAVTMKSEVLLFVTM
jgi:hypothetical protein